MTFFHNSFLHDKKLARPIVLFCNLKFRVYSIDFTANGITIKQRTNKELRLNVQSLFKFRLIHNLKIISCERFICGCVVIFTILGNKLFKCILFWVFSDPINSKCSQNCARPGENIQSIRPQSNSGFASLVSSTKKVSDFSRVRVRHQKSRVESSRTFTLHSKPFSLQSDLF